MLKTLSQTDEEYLSFLDAKNTKYLNKLKNFLSESFVTMEINPPKKSKEVVPHIFLAMAISQSSELLSKHIIKKYGGRLI